MNNTIAKARLNVTNIELSANSFLILSIIIFISKVI